MFIRARWGRGESRQKQKDRGGVHGGQELQDKKDEISVPKKVRERGGIPSIALFPGARAKRPREREDQRRKQRPQEVTVTCGESLKKGGTSHKASKKEGKS